jgi:hypothetical protein
VVAQIEREMLVAVYGAGIVWGHRKDNFRRWKPAPEEC